VQIVEKLLEIEDIDIDLQDNDGRTAVFHAALRIDGNGVHEGSFLIDVLRIDIDARAAQKSSHKLNVVTGTTKQETIDVGTTGADDNVSGK
jgi:ankyrin repeat protein